MRPTAQNQITINIILSSARPFFVGLEFKLIDFIFNSMRSDVCQHQNYFDWFGSYNATHLLMAMFDSIACKHRFEILTVDPFIKNRIFRIEDLDSRKRKKLMNKL